MYQPQTGSTKAYHTFPSHLHVTGANGRPVHRQPDQLSEADFAIHASDASVDFTVNRTGFNASFAAEGAVLEIQGSGAILSWGSLPGDSPEGIAMIGY